MRERASRAAAATVHAERTLQLDVPAARVWELIGGFDAMPRLHPAVLACELAREEATGATLRRIRLKDGGLIVNRLEEVNEAARFYRYSIVESPFPVSDYECRLAVRENGPGACIVEWTSNFTPSGIAAAEAARLFEGMFDEGLESLKRVLMG